MFAQTFQTYLIFEAVNFWGFQGPAEMRGNYFEKKTRSFRWFSSKSEVEATCLIGWPHKTSTNKGLPNFKFTGPILRGFYA